MDGSQAGIRGTRAKSHLMCSVSHINGYGVGSDFVQMPIRDPSLSRYPTCWRSSPDMDPCKGCLAEKRATAAQCLSLKCPTPNIRPQTSPTSSKEKHPKPISLSRESFIFFYLAPLKSTGPSVNRPHVAIFLGRPSNRPVHPSLPSTSTPH